MKKRNNSEYEKERRKKKKEELFNESVIKYQKIFQAMINKYKEKNDQPVPENEESLDNGQMMEENEIVFHKIDEDDNNNTENGINNKVYF